MEFGELLRTPVGGLALSTLREQSYPVQTGVLLVLGDAGESLSSKVIRERVSGLLGPDFLDPSEIPDIHYTLRSFFSAGLLLPTGEKYLDDSEYGLTDYGEASVDAFRRYAATIRSGLRMYGREGLAEVSSEKERRELMRLYPDPGPTSEQAPLETRELINHATFRIMKEQSVLEHAMVLASLAALPENNRFMPAHRIAREVYNRDYERPEWKIPMVKDALASLSGERLVRTIYGDSYKATPLGIAANRALGEYIQVLDPVLNRMCQPVRDFMGGTLNP